MLEIERKDFTGLWRFDRNCDGQRKIKTGDEWEKKDEFCHFVMMERGKKGVPRKTLEVRLSDRGDIGEGE